MIRITPPLTIAVILGCIIALPLGAQEVPHLLSPADVAGRRLHPLIDTMNVVLVRDGVRRSGGQFIVTLTTAKIGGRLAYLAIAHDVSPTGAHTFDTTAVDASTLAPLWHRSHAPTDSAAVEYRGRVASGYAAHQNQPRTPIDARLSASAFEGSMMSWILPALPLEVGYAISVVTVSPWSAGEDTTSFRVIASEPLTLHTGTVETWVIQEKHGSTDKAVRKQWIDKASKRTLQTFDGPPRAAPVGDGYWKISTLVKAPPTP